jgi:hypothetical protein
MGAPGCVTLGPRCHEIGLSNSRFLVLGPELTQGEE